MGDKTTRFALGTDAFMITRGRAVCTGCLLRASMSFRFLPGLYLHEFFIKEHFSILVRAEDITVTLKYIGSNADDNLSGILI